MGSSQKRVARIRAGGAMVVALVIVTGMGAVGCDSEFQPTIEDELTLRSTFVEYSLERVQGGTVPFVDGVANNLEWGSPDDPQRPYSYIQITAENGFGAPGVSKFVAVKSAYTALWDPTAGDGQGAYRVLDVYFLLQWADLEPEPYKDSFVYDGPDIFDAEPRVRQWCSEQLPEGTDSQLQRCVDDSLVAILFDEDDNARPEHWYQAGDDDRVMMFLGDGTATDTRGRRFRDFGTQVVENGSGGFGPLGSGFIDAWLWSASRTNPLREATRIGDQGQDFDPQEGFSGFAADYHITDAAALTYDSGPSLWIRNFDPQLTPEDRVPLRVWFLRSDPNRGEEGQSQCSQLNNGIAFPHLHRESVASAVFMPEAGLPRTVNERPFKWEDKDPEVARFWRPDDFVSGYLLGHDGRARDEIDSFQFCFNGCPGQGEGEQFIPNCGGRDYDDPPHSLNTLQTRARGAWNPVTRHWVLEMTRPVRTPWGNTNGEGNDVEDHDFDGLLDGPREFVFSLALWDGQDDGGPHWGSAPVTIKFNPPPPREDD